MIIADFRNQELSFVRELRDGISMQGLSKFKFDQHKVIIFVNNGKYPAGAEKMIV